MGRPPSILRPPLAGVLVISATLFWIGCAPPADDAARERQAIEQAIHASIGWAKTKDLGLLYSVIAQDSAYVEVDPGDRIVKGFEEFKRNEEFWMHPDFTAVGYAIRDLRVSISRGGEVAWFFCILDDMNTWKGEPANWLNTRWTGVLEKRSGKWTIVQMHFSFPAASSG